MREGRCDIIEILIPFPPSSYCPSSLPPLPTCLHNPPRPATLQRSSRGLIALSSHVAVNVFAIDFSVVCALWIKIGAGRGVFRVVRLNRHIVVALEACRSHLPFIILLGNDRLRSRRSPFSQASHHTQFRSRFFQHTQYCLVSAFIFAFDDG
ncbi:hypothetical protein K439DRAFT_565025 [Ramaria rubella]|nr:hypothetical protein K439DRAFT_565025 [Ramaria rubella]